MMSTQHCSSPWDRPDIGAMSRRVSRGFVAKRIFLFFDTLSPPSSGLCWFSMPSAFHSLLNHRSSMSMDVEPMMSSPPTTS